MNEPSVLRYMALVLKPSSSLVVALALVAGLSMWIGWTDQASVRQLIVLALVAQMFAASTGFRDRAVRGHFDAVLVADRSRWATAGAHWLLSVAPGAVLWILVTIVVAVFAPKPPPESLTSSGLAAFAYTSCLAWAVSLPLTRHAGGVIWMLALFILAGADRIHVLREVFLRPAGHWTDALSRAGAALVCPVFLIADQDGSDGELLALVAIATVAAAVLGAVYVARLDVPLRDPS